ncbi:uncharacterized protein [Ptychodera flava]
MNIYKIWFAAVFLYAMVFIVSVILLVGVQNDQKTLLLPYFLYMIFYLVVDTAMIVYVTRAAGLTEMNVFNIVFWVLRIIITLCCELCVISQYQLLSASGGSNNETQDGAILDETQSSFSVSLDAVANEISISDDSTPATVFPTNFEVNSTASQPPFSKAKSPSDELFRPRTAPARVDDVVSRNGTGASTVWATVHEVEIRDESNMELPQPSVHTDTEPDMKGSPTTRVDEVWPMMMSSYYRMDAATSTTDLLHETMRELTADVNDISQRAQNCVSIIADVAEEQKILRREMEDIYVIVR